MHHFFSLLVFLLLDGKFQVYPCTRSALICNLKGTVQMSKCHSKHICRGLTAVVCCVGDFLVCFFVFCLVGWVCLFGLLCFLFSFVYVFVWFCLSPNRKDPSLSPPYKEEKNAVICSHGMLTPLGKKTKGTECNL